MPLTVKKFTIDLTWRKCCHHDSDFNLVFTSASILRVTSRDKTSRSSSVMSRIGSFR